MSASHGLKLTFPLVVAAPLCWGQSCSPPVQRGRHRSAFHVKNTHLIAGEVVHVVAVTVELSPVFDPTKMPLLLPVIVSLLIARSKSCRPKHRSTSR